MGGYVARLTIARYPQLQSLLENIVTLATPHSNPLYAFDATVHRIHQQIIQTLDAQEKGQSLWVSLSGGLRDEMIAPLACEIRGGYSVRSADAIWWIAHKHPSSMYFTGCQASHENPTSFRNGPRSI